MLLSEFTFGLGILDAITTSHGFKVVAENFVYFLGGAWYTIFITTLSVAMGMVLGLFAGLGIDKGQMEAARSLGMNERQAMVLVILPQAFKVVIPPLINEFIALLKDSSLVSAITVAELMHRGDLVFANTYQATWVFGTIALLYLIMTKTIAILGDYTERRLATE
jgi:ABC-type amino acid transport system permease subunit